MRGGVVGITPKAEGPAAYAVKDWITRALAGRNPQESWHDIW